jgi:DNA-binding FadR family transcriptional regulator
VAKTTTPSTGLIAIHRVGSARQVRDQLMSAIERGVYPPGTFLPSERVLCETLGVSRVSVREAIAGLDAMNLITVQHGKGALVRDDAGNAIADSFGRYLGEHRDELLELLRVRQALDGLAAEGAARTATKESATDLQRLNDLFVKASQGPAPDLVELARCDVAFHLAIASASGGTLLPRMLGELNEVLSESRHATLSRRGQLAASARQHQAIVDAIALGDEKAAQQAARRHMTGIITWVSTFGLEPAHD